MVRDAVDPAELLAAARGFEVGMRLTERTAQLDKLAGALTDPSVRPAPPGHDWRLELDAERAIDLARLKELTAAQLLAGEVLAAVGDRAPVAKARASEALGRALAWVGTEGATRRAERVSLDAAEQYRALGETEWYGFALFWTGNTVHLQNGRLDEAAALMVRSLEVLGPSSPRRPNVLSFYADLLIARGDWAPAEALLEEGGRLAAEHDDSMARAYIAWSRARMSSQRGDARATERALIEAERDAGDWFDTHTGATFLADAAELLDRVHLPDAADAYLLRAQQHDATDEFVAQSRAALLARRGEPDEALAALRELTRGDWLEKRVVWRHTLFAAYATLRAGRDGAGDLAAQALAEAATVGGTKVAAVGEPELVATLLPLAEAAGSAHARTMLAGSGALVVRLFGTMSLSRDGEAVSIPPGQAAELFRMVAVAAHPVSTAEVLDTFFPDTEPAAARHRLRQLLTRIRSFAGDVIVREGEQLRLAPAWVDVLAFRATSERALRARQAELAHAALALWTGPPLPADPYAGWASVPREQLRRRYLALLDVVADDAEQRGSSDEVLRALAQARDEDPYDESRYVRAAALLVRNGRRGAAVQLAREARGALAEIAVPLPDELAALFVPGTDATLT